MKKAEQRSLEPRRAGSCEEVRFVLVKLAAIWPASELVLEVIFIAAFIAWRALRRESAVLPASAQLFS